MIVISPFKIGLVGAPGSGKTTFGAMLYAELLKRGINSTRLVPEMAAEHLGRGGNIDTVAEQVSVTHQQMVAEFYIEKCGFNPIICDSATFIGEVYMADKLLKFPDTNIDELFMDKVTIQQFMMSMEEQKCNYDIIIYCPLFNEHNQINKFRIHDNDQSQKLSEDMRNILRFNPKFKKIFWLPVSYSDRNIDLQTIVDYILENYQKGKH